MAHSRTIRAWANEQGAGLSDRGAIPTEWRRKFYEAHDETESEPTPLPSEPSEVIEEVAPKVGDPEPLLGRVVNRAKKAAAPKRGRKPVRNSVSKVVAFGYSMLAGPASMLSKPVGFMMTIQAPVVGDVLDPVIANTLIDKILQPFAKIREDLEPVNAVLGPLVFVYMLERFPSQEERITGYLRDSLLSWAQIAQPHYDALKVKAEMMAEETGTDIDEVIESVKAVINLSRMEKEAADWG